MSFKVQANEGRNPNDFCRQCGAAIPPNRLIESITAREHDCSGYYCSQRCEERAAAQYETVDHPADAWERNIAI